MEFVLLGGIAVFVDGGALDLGPARQRCVLAALAVDAGRVVSVERLVGRVWGEHPPLRARATLLNYLSRLRLLFADADTDAGTAVVARRPGGYVLDVERSAVDLLRFRALCAQARAGDDGQAVALLRQALGLWQGEALTGIDGEWAEAERDRLHQQLLDAECDLAEVLLRLGHGEDLVATLGARTTQWPLDERVAAQFMLALHRAGRTADALAHYRQLRDRLVEQLGTDPGSTVQDLHQRILDTDPALTRPSAAISGETAARAGAPVPRQLPAPPRWFTGRGTELARLDQALTAEPDEGHLPSTTGSGALVAATVVISAIGGAGGIGKTWLALAWAHQHAEQFPDGHLFTDLRGFNPTEQPVTPDTALFGFLSSLGVAPDRIPTDLDAKAALYRSLVAGKRMLIVLDNAATPDQVVPLLPGSSTCTVLVTSRNRLHGLTARHGARTLPLGVLTDAEARALLIATLGVDRVVADEPATAELIALCGGFPLALGLIAARAQPDLCLDGVARDLRESGLDALDSDDPTSSLPAVLSWSLRHLTDEQRTVFALLGIAPGADIGMSAAANLTGLSERKVRAVLRALSDASLIDPSSGGRYAMHDLVRAYATTNAHHNLAEDTRLAALRRVTDFYLHTTFATGRLLTPYPSLRPVITRLTPAVPGVRVYPLEDASAAMAWLGAEHANLLAVQRAATTHQWYQVVWELACCVNGLHIRQGNLHDRLAVWRAALDAAEHLSDATTRSHAHRNLGIICLRLGRREDATAYLEQALAVAEHHHDATEQAFTHLAFAGLWESLGNSWQALEHAKRALDLGRTLDQPVWKARMLCAVGWQTARLGDYDTGRTHCRDALTLYRRHHNSEGEASALTTLAWIDQQTNDHRRAIHHYRPALALLRKLGNMHCYADALEYLGGSYAALGFHEQARTVWQENLELQRQLGRDTDANRVLRRLDALDSESNPLTESAT